MPIKLLFLAASPTDTARLNVDQECRAIGKALRSAELLRDRFTIENHGAVRLEDLHQLLALHRPQIVHFSGHGSAFKEIVLETSSGSNHPVSAEALGQLFSVFKNDIRCVILNACDSEEQTDAIARHIDCVIGISQAISDSASIFFATAFYQSLAYGQDVRSAFDAGCNALRLHNPDEKNTPRLIALRADATQIVLTDPSVGNPSAPLPPIDITALPARPAAFQGRRNELEILEHHLTGKPRPRILTLYGAAGQGKTTLARQAIERFAAAWPGGVLAVSFENLPTRLDLVLRLAEFLKIDPTQLTLTQTERRVIHALESRPTLLVLDHAETLLEELERSNLAAANLTEWLQDRLPAAVTLFLISRSHFGLSGEQSLELGGLSPSEGAQLFQQSAPDCPPGFDPRQAEALSRTVEGHPLCLRLLGLAFNYSGPDLPAFIRQFERQLALVTNRYKALDQQQRTLFACIETSIAPLARELQTLLPQLTLFHSPFRPLDAVAIFDPTASTSPLPHQLWQLWQRGLLERQIHSTAGAPLELYHLAPPLRLYAAQTAAIPPDALQRFARVYANLARWIWAEMDKDPSAALLIRLTSPDLERGLEHSEESARAWYNLHLGQVEYRLGNPWKGKPRLEQALEWGRDHDQALVSQSLNGLGAIYKSTGQSQEALKYYREALLIDKGMDNRAEEATMLTHIGAVYDDIGQPKEALKYYFEALPISKDVHARGAEAAILNAIGAACQRIGQSQDALKYYCDALPIMKDVDDRPGEAATLNNIGMVYDGLDQPQEALKYYAKALPIYQEVDDRSGEAAALHNIGVVYGRSNQPQEALKYLQEALPIRKEVRNRIGEAATLHAIGWVYDNFNQPREALKYYREAFLIMREVGDRTGEAATLNNMALILIQEGQNRQALDLLQQILNIHQEMGTVAGEAVTLYALAFLLGRKLGKPGQAIPLLRRSIKILKTNHLPQDDAGQTVADHEALLAELESQT
jgi:tetratricopeptide (TPR) repeat protein